MDQKFDSELYNLGESWSFTFDESGTYDYFCTIHPWMIGKVTVIATQQSEEKKENDVLKIPEWIKTNAGWWSQGLLSDEEFARSIQYLISNEIIKI